MHRRKFAAWTVCAAVAACFHPDYQHVRCSPEGLCPDGMQCSLQHDCVSVPDGIADQRSFDLAALKAGQIVDMTVDAPRSSLTPNAYTYGGLIAHGLAGTKLWDRSDTAWSKLATVTANGAGLWRGESFTTGDKLDYLGIANDSAGTLWFEGEVWLDASSGEFFGLTADDVAFVDLALPGTQAYVRVTDNAALETPVATPVSGWYPIRIGFANGDGSYALSFTHREMGGAPVRWQRDRLRARGSEIAGTMRTVFGHRLLGGGLGAQPPVVHVEAGSLLATTNFGVPPQGVAPTNDLWSARYVGQAYIDQPGRYALRVDSDDGNRVRLDTGRDENGWGANGRPGVTSATAQLSQGWADLFVDYDQLTGNRALHVRLQQPDSTLLEIPPDRLRPVESSDDRLVSSSDDTSHTILNGDPTKPGVATFNVAGYPGETVSSIDVTFFVNSFASDQLKADLEMPPGGTRVPIRGHATIDNSQGAQVTILPTAVDATATLLNGPATGAWKLDVYDDTPGCGCGGNSTLLSAKLTLHTRGGPDKIARTASWTSAVIDATTNVLAVDGVTWRDRVPDGASVEVQLATCQRADCSDAAFSPAPKGMAFAVTPGRYLQLRVGMTSDGTHEPELKELSIAFRRAPM